MIFRTREFCAHFSLRKGYPIWWQHYSRQQFLLMRVILCHKKWISVPAASTTLFSPLAVRKWHFVDVWWQFRWENFRFLAWSVTLVLFWKMSQINVLVPLMKNLCLSLDENKKFQAASSFLLPIFNPQLSNDYYLLVGGFIRPNMIPNSILTCAYGMWMEYA